MLAPAVCRQRGTSNSERHGRETGFKVVLDSTILILVLVMALLAFFTEACRRLSRNVNNTEDIKTASTCPRLRACMWLSPATVIAVLLGPFG